LYPTNQVVLSYYGTCLARTGQPEKALPFLEKAAQLQPNNLDYWLNLARAALEAGQPALAKSALEKAAALAGDNPAVLQLRFKFCWQTEDYPAAREIMLRWNQIAPGDEHAYWLSEVEKKTEEDRQVIRQTERLLTLNGMESENPGSLLCLAGRVIFALIVLFHSGKWIGGEQRLSVAHPFPASGTTVPVGRAPCRPELFLYHRASLTKRICSLAYCICLQRSSRTASCQ